MFTAQCYIHEIWNVMQGNAYIDTKIHTSRSSSEQTKYRSYFGIIFVCYLALNNYHSVNHERKGQRNACACQECTSVRYERNTYQTTMLYVLC